MKIYVLLYFEHKYSEIHYKTGQKNNVTIIAKFLLGATSHSRSFIMIVKSFYVQNVMERGSSWHKYFIIYRRNAADNDAECHNT